MKPTFRTVWKIYIRKPLLLVLTGFLISVSIIVPLSVSTAFSYTAALEESLLLNAISVALLGLISYELTSEVIDSDENEALKVLPKVRLWELTAGFLLVLGILLLSCVLQYSINGIRAVQYGITDGVFFIHLLKAVFIRFSSGPDRRRYGRGFLR